MVHLVLAALALSGCAALRSKPDMVHPKSNLQVYRLHRGFQPNQIPTIVINITADEYQKFQRNFLLEDSKFRRKNFYTGCYLFQYNQKGRAVASVHENTYCYQSEQDRFISKSQLLRN